MNNTEKEGHETTTESGLLQPVVDSILSERKEKKKTHQFVYKNLFS